MIVDENIAFKEINRVVMLWTVRNLWPSGARFFFNCYCHWSLIILWNGNGTTSFMHIMEGLTTAYPTVLIKSRIGTLPLIKNLKQDIPDVIQPWYADDTGALGTFRKN